MKFKELKDKLAHFNKYPGTSFIEPAPMINEGYPSNFNLSFAYYEWTKKEGHVGQAKQYITYAGDMCYSKSQPCVRPQDWKTIVEDGENKYRYLSYFHMSDVGGLIAKVDEGKREEIGIFSIKSVINFFKEVGLDINKVHVAYCQGGKVVDLTDGKYAFEKTVASDPFYSEWIKAGISESNMIPDGTRDTLLSLRNYSRPSPWGYRNEVFYMHQGRLLDVATIEHLCFEPVFDKEMNIVDIKDYRHAFSIGAVGVERLLTVINDYADVRQIDILAPLYDTAKSEIDGISETDADILVQTLRSVQALIADGGQWKSLNSRRRELARAFYMEIANVLDKYNLKLSNPALRGLMEFNAELLENKKLGDSIDAVIAELKERLSSMSDNKHIPEETRHAYKRVVNDAMWYI